AEGHDERERGEHEVVGEERRFARYRRIDATGRSQAVAAPGDEPDAGGGDDPEEDEQRGTDRRLRERMDRVEDAGPGEERPEDRQAERRDHEREVPDAQHAATF